ncbi:hypothetical protein PtB15_9B201 [Puccinia triticina]|nr:hypothetical protein PtB15_9B201 [Puccinia triticina]
MKKPGVASASSSDQVNDRVNGPQKIESHMKYTEKPIDDSYFENLGRFSIRSIQPDVLDIFVQKFRTRIEVLSHDWLRCRYSQEVPFGRFPIVSIRRVVRLVDQSTHSYMGKRELIKRIKRLITWLLLVNTAILRRFTSSSNPESEMASHVKLIDRITREIFEPESGIPIIGKVELENFIPDESVFQKHQVDIIEHLTRGLSNSVAVRTACRLAVEYYKDYNPHIASMLGGSDEARYAFLMNVVVVDAIESRMNIRNTLNTLSRAGAQSAELRLIGLKEFPEGIKPQKNYPDMSLLGFKENSTLQEIQNKHSVRELTIRTPQNCEDLPVQVLSLPSSTHLIRMTNKFHETISTQKILEKAKGLLNYTLLCHIIFVGQFKNDDGTEKSEDLHLLHQNFLDFLYNKSFQPAHSLPIFGQALNFNDLDALTSSRFGEVQKLLISYFSESRAHEILPQISVALLEYWYRKYNKPQWLIFFTDEKHFDKNRVLALLEQNQDFFKGFRKEDFKRTSNPNLEESTRKRGKQET